MNRIQNIRKDKGFEVTDKITVKIKDNGLITNSVKNNFNYICNEVLADSFSLVSDLDDNDGILIDVDDQIQVLTSINKITHGSWKTRYSDKELIEFKELIIKKLEDARKELVNLQAALNSANEHGTDDTANTFKVLEDGSDTLAKEEAGQLAARQKKFIEQLENALIRIENKTYGVCRVTGKLIPKERLRAVPHTTQSIEAKLQQYKD